MNRSAARRRGLASGRAPWVTTALALALALALAAACTGADAPPPEAVESGEEGPAVVETRWTARSELFMEYPPLVAGETSRFAIHFTDLDTFAPVRTGGAVVRLSAGGAARTGGAGGMGGPQTFAADGPGRPGIFGVDVTPARAGRYRLEVLLATPALEDRHDLGEVSVRPAGSAGPDVAQEAGNGADDDAISFLKEQQWAFDFATAPAEHRQVSDSLLIAGQIEPRAGGRADVTTPVAGRLTPDLPARPVGTRVSRGDVLAEIIPHSGHGEDRPALELAVAEARNALALARAERTRVDRLVAAGALPARRKLEAQVAEQTAEARMTAADAHLAQLDATRTAQGDGGPDVRFLLRAPIGGFVAASEATPGASVAQGESLFRIVALDRVYVVGSLPEAALARLGDLAGAELEVAGFDAPIALDRLVSVGRVLDAEARTVPIIYELRNPDRRLAVGQAVSMRIFASAATDAVTVPESAIVDDAGQPVVFVQVGGESFERRGVRLGNREGRFVQIRGEVEPGERVVTRGAPLIRLAALSPQVPAHGHTH